MLTNTRDTDTARMVVAGLVVVVTALGVTGLLFGPRPPVAMGRTAYVLVASTGFLGAALTAGALRTVYGRWMLVGLVGCWAGDVLGREVSFTSSAVAFLLGHLAFMMGFSTMGIRAVHFLRAGGAALVASLAAVAWLAPHLEAADYALVLPYVAVITAMVACAGGVWARPPGHLAAVGAVVFYISDLFVARWQYVGGGWENGLFCYPLYYTACLLLALSCFPAAGAAAASERA